MSLKAPTLKSSTPSYPRTLGAMIFTVGFDNYSFDDKQAKRPVIMHEIYSKWT